MAGGLQLIQIQLLILRFGGPFLPAVPAVRSWHIVHNAVVDLPTALLALLALGRRWGNPFWRDLRPGLGVLGWYRLFGVLTQYSIYANGWLRLRLLCVVGV